MSFDAFLKIDGCPGESTDEKHPDWIEISSYSFGVSQGGAGKRSTGGGASGERADFADFSIEKDIDKATNKLLEAAATGKHIKEITLELCRATGKKQKYLEYKLFNSIITTINPSGIAGANPTESVSFNFGKIKTVFTVTDHETGASKGDIPFGWDLTKNKAF